MDVSGKKENSAKRENEKVPCIANAESVMDVSAEGGNEAETVLCASNGEDNSFDVEPAPSEQVGNPGGCNLDVNITEDVNSDANGLSEANYDDETECSSSFADTYPEGSSDAEVESQLHSCDPMASIIFPRRKKNVSVQWRRFIRPLMSSCKWLELKIHDIQSRNAKYGTEIAKHDERKQYEFRNFTVDDCSVKSVPFSGHTRQKAMRRTKRKRVEDATDVASYVSQHKVFSYFEKKKHVANGASSLDFNNLVKFERKTMNGNNDLLLDDEFYPFKQQNNFDCPEGILRKIEMAKSHVRGLKFQVDKVALENPTKFSSLNKLSYLAPRDSLTIACRSSASLRDGDGMIHGSMYTSSHHKSKFSNGGNIVKPEIGVSSDEEVASLPDIAADIKPLQDGGSCNEIDDDILINNQTANEELQHIGTIGNQLPHQGDKLPSSNSLQGPISNEGNSSSKPVVHMAPRRKRRRRRHKWGF